MMKFVDGFNVFLARLNEEVFSDGCFGRNGSIWRKALNLHRKEL